MKLQFFFALAFYFVFSFSFLHFRRFSRFQGNQLTPSIGPLPLAHVFLTRSFSQNISDKPAQNIASHALPAELATTGTQIAPIASSQAQLEPYASSAASPLYGPSRDAN